MRQLDETSADVDANKQRRDARLSSPRAVFMVVENGGNWERSERDREKERETERCRERESVCCRELPTDTMKSLNQYHVGCIACFVALFCLMNKRSTFTLHAL